MTVIEFLNKAQYSRLTVGQRWMTIGHNGFKVLERKKYHKHTTVLGEELYHDLL